MLNRYATLVMMAATEKFALRKNIRRQVESYLRKVREYYAWDGWYPDGWEEELDSEEERRFEETAARMNQKMHRLYVKIEQCLGDAKDEVWEYQVALEKVEEEEDGTR